MNVTSFRTVWLVPNRGFVDAAPLLDDVDTLLDAYLAEERLSCCSVQGGFFVDVDGVPWSNDGTVDEPHMTNAWFHALRELLSGAAHAGPGIGPWEQSMLTFERRGSIVVMEDAIAGRAPAMRRVKVPFVPFFLEVLEGGRLLRELSAKLRDVVAKRRASVTHEVAARLDVVADNVFLEGDLADLEVLEEKLRAFDTGT